MIRKGSWVDYEKPAQGRLCMKSIRKLFPIILILSCFFLIGLGLQGVALAGKIQLPQTGQTTCYDSAGTVIPCAGTGQDGDIQAGVAWPNPRFTVSGDCVTDNLTGLMWAKNGNLSNGTKTLQGALDYIASINSGSGLCGHNDWRLPNVNELVSLIHKGQSNSADWLNTQNFVNVQSDGFYISSTTGSHLGCLEVIMSTGNVDSGGSGYVWPVRDEAGGRIQIPKTGQTKCYDALGSEISCVGTGQDGDIQAGDAWLIPRFTDYGNGTVGDNLTGLIWLKDANCIQTYYPDYGREIYSIWPGDISWQHALDFVKGINNGTYPACGAGYQDWRLPNYKELLSLIDYGSQTMPALPLNHPFTNLPFAYGGQHPNYWSSTLYYNVPAIINMINGTAMHAWLSNGTFVWPVHGGQVGSLCPVSGKLQDSLSRLSQSGIKITIDNFYSYVTDSNGFYSFPGLSCGNHTLTVDVSPGYSNYSRTVDTSKINTLDILLTKNTTVQGSQTPSGYGPDPVNTATGNYIYQKKDLEIPGSGIPFLFERNYNSQDSVDGPLGFGWNHTYNAQLTVNADSTITIRWGDGKTETWTPDGSGGYIPQYGVFDTLINNGDGTYTLRKKDLTRYNFASSGNLSSIVDKNSNTITATHTGNNLTQITDPVGRNITLTFDGNNRITQITDPINRTLQYAYDSNGDLVTATDMNGNITTYTYDSNHQLLTVVDPRGNTVVTNTYDAQKRVVTSQRDAKGGQTTYTYSEVDRITPITDQLGQAYYHYHDDLLRLIQEKDVLGNSAYYTYDYAGNRTQVKDKKGNITTYTYDSRGNVLTKTDALSNVTTITYDSNNNPLTRIDALSKTTSFEYDANENLTKTTDPLSHFTTIAYTINGLPATITDALGYSTTYGYDSQGNLTTLTDALSHQTQYTYDGAGRKLTQTDALGRTTSYTYDNNNNPLTITDPLGGVITYTYDGNNNKLTFKDPKGNITRYAYDVKDLLTTITDPLNYTVTYTYDALDRRISETDKRGNTTTYTFDAVGNRVGLLTPDSKLYTFTYDANGNKLTETNPLGQITTYTYDALNRLTSISDPLGSTSTTAYNSIGKIITSTNAKGQATGFEYDALGRLTKVTDSNGGIVTYTYDSNGNRLTLTDPNGKTTSHVYDALNRMTQKVEPLGNTYQYAYDAVGNRTGLTDAKGNVITYAYDGNNRLKTITYPGASTVTFTYDQSGNRVEMTDNLGTSSYSYDNLNRMTSSTNPHGKVVGYGYDANGNRTSLTYPDGKQVTYSYDALNRMKTVADWQSRTTTYTYDSAGNLTNLLNPNQTTAGYTYDAAGRLTGLTNQKSNATVLSTYSYALDALGNQLSVNKTEPLAPALTGKNIAYTYDNENRLTQAGSTANSYDANGNLIARGSDTFSYDYNDRLIQSNMGGENDQYTYDGLGNRLIRVKEGVTTRYVLDISGTLSNVLAETDGSGTITVYYIHGLGLIAKILPNGAPYYYHYDSRGSTIALTDSTQNQTDAYAYDSFGSVANSTGSTPNPFKYVGGYGVMDEGNGLKYIRARYYSPELGRFITKDPITGKEGDSQSLNRYVYALNNPVRLVDVSGFSAKEGNIHSAFSGSSDLRHESIINREKTIKLMKMQSIINDLVYQETLAANYESQVQVLEATYNALMAIPGLATGMGIGTIGDLGHMVAQALDVGGQKTLSKWVNSVSSGIDLLSSSLDIYKQVKSISTLGKAWLNSPIDVKNVLTKMDITRQAGNIWSEALSPFATQLMETGANFFSDVFSK